jgi:hypothetical protein
MKPIFALFLLVLATVPLAATPVIKSISPGLGTVTGGDTVTIVVDTPLYSCPICSPPAYEADVTFGGVPARSVVAWNDTITAVTPAHASGTVTVAVSSHGTPYGTTTFSYYSYGSGIIDRRNYEKVLLPLALPEGKSIPGAFGSLWSSDLWVSNPTAYPVELFSDISCTFVCAAPVPGDHGYPQMQAGSLIRLGPLDTGGNYGLVYYVQKTYANDVSFSLHVRDTSRTSENAGTEIGVVRERMFRGSSFDILNVPIDANSRATLRVYDVNALDNISADVAFYSMDFNTLIASTNIPLTVSVKKDTTLAANFPPLAGFGQIGDIRNYFAFIQAGFPGHVRVHVELKNGANQGWGFVTVTNNATQLITTYRPE